MAIETIKFSQMTSGGDLSPNQQTPGLLSGSNVLFNNPWTFLAPGSTGNRPIPTPDIYYRLRFNTTLEVYEYYDPTIPIWVQLSGTGTGTVNPGVANDIAFYAASGQAVSPIASASNSVLITNASGIPSLATILPAGLSIPGATITASTASLLSGSVSAVPLSGNDLTNKSYVDSLFSAGVISATGTTNQVLVNGSSAVPASGNITLSLPQDIALGSTPTFAGMTLSSIPLGSSSGGTGINNGTNTITIAGNLQTIGAFSSIFRMTAATDVTFPASGTLLTSANAVTDISGTTNQIVSSASTGSVTLSLASNPVLPGTAGMTFPSGNTAARAGAAGTMRFNSQTSVFEATTDGVIWSTVETSLTAISTAVTQVFSANGTYTPTTGMKYCIVECVGGGAGGGGSATTTSVQTSAGGGGGGGEYTRTILTAADIGASKAVIIGTGGIGGPATGGNGGGGGTTSLGATLASAIGGSPGSGMAAQGGSASASGGAGGTGGVGTFSITGQSGQASIALYTATAYNVTGGAGGSPGVYGCGGFSSQRIAISGGLATGNAGSGYGAGGGGACSAISASGAAGAAGKSGYMIITEFI